MKKRILIICSIVATISLTAFTCSNMTKTKIARYQPAANVNNNVDAINTIEPPAFIYDVDSRFFATITKENLLKAKTIVDLVPKKSNWKTKTFHDVKIYIHAEGEDPFATGDGNALSAAQIDLLKTADYSTNFNIEAYAKQENADNDKIKGQRYAYYVTIVPEKEAEYKAGNDAMINYLKGNSKANLFVVNEGYLKPGKVYFTVSQNGTITNVDLNSTCGYPSVDAKMIDLITNMPGKWDVATNAQGEKVDQMLVFSYGIMGC